MENMPLNDNKKKLNPTFLIAFICILALQKKSTFKVKSLQKKKKNLFQTQQEIFTNHCCKFFRMSK